MGDPAAPPVLLIHGLGGQLRHLTYRLAPLLASDFYVVVVDRAGSGYSPRRPHPRVLDAQAAQLAELIDARNLQSTLVVGHSLGAAVAIELAQLRPDQVGALALITPALVTQKVPKGFRPLMIKGSLLRGLVAWTVAVPVSAMRSAIILGQIFRPDAAPDDFGTAGGGLLYLRPGAFIESSDELVSLISRSDEEPWRLAPSLTIGSIFAMDDAVIDPTIQSQALTRNAPHGRIEYLGGTGHMLPITHPEDCAALVRSVFQRWKQSVSTTPTTSMSIT
jgi:pimeloyl-ACP methyl ester carboxylesterase